MPLEKKEFQRKVLELQQQIIGLDDAEQPAMIVESVVRKILEIAEDEVSITRKRQLYEILDPAKITRKMRMKFSDEEIENISYSTVCAFGALMSDDPEVAEARAYWDEYEKNDFDFEDGATDSIVSALSLDRHFRKAVRKISPENPQELQNCVTEAIQINMITGKIILPAELEAGIPGRIVLTLMVKLCASGIIGKEQCEIWMES